MMNIAKLKAAALAAGGEEWRTSYIPPYGRHYVVSTDGRTVVNLSEGDVPARYATFIAAANPGAVLDLIAALEAKDDQIAERDGALEREREKSRRMASHIAELEARTVKLPLLNDDLVAILGRPCFTCAHLAELMRKSGDDIRRKAEHEQAAVIYWFLGLYLEHGDKWEAVAKAEIQSRVAAAGINLETGGEA